MKAQKKVYRIEIKSKHSDHIFFFWIGPGLELVSTLAEAIPVSDDEHMFVMSKIHCEATAFMEVV